MSWQGPHERSAEVRALWREFVTREHEIPRRVSPSGHYVCPFLPGAEDFEYHIGVEVDREPMRVPDGMETIAVPPCRYAVFTHAGPMSRVPESYAAAFAWLEAEGLTQDGTRASVERYDDRFHPTRDAPERAHNAYDFELPVRDD